MLGSQYLIDSRGVTEQALLFAKSLNLSSDGKDLWIFDTDETSLSNLPFLAEKGFGEEPFDESEFYEWILKGDAPAPPKSLKLYQWLLSLGVKVAFLTGRAEDKRNITNLNLKTAGFHTWESLYSGERNFPGKHIKNTSQTRERYWRILMGIE